LLSEQIGYTKGIGNYYNAKGLINMIKGRDYPLAIISFQKALNIRTEINDIDGLGWTYNNMGLMYGDMGNYIESLKSHTKALKVRTQRGDKIGMSESIRKRGGSYLILGNYTEALKDFLMALKYGEEAHSSVCIESSYTCIAEFYAKEGHYSEAIKYYTLSAKAREPNADKFAIGTYHLNIAEVYLLKGDTTDAIENNYTAMKIFEEIHSIYNLLTVYNNMGKIKYYHGDYDQALIYFMKTMKISKEYGGKNTLTNSYIWIGMVYVKQNKYQDALKYFTDALSIASEFGYKDGVKEAYKNLAIIYSKLNNYKLAFEYQTLYQQLRDSLLNEENISKMKQLEMQYNYDKETAIQKAEQDKKDTLLEKEVETQKFRRNTIFAGMVVLVVFLVIVIFLRNRISKERRQKALEQERSRISKDLHDDLGAGLTKISLMSQDDGTAAGDNKKNTLQRINIESSDMVDQMNSIIWALNTRNDSLPNLITFIKKNAFGMFEESHSINLIWNAPEKIPERYMNGELRKNIYLVIKEALHNALKYSKASEVKVNIDVNKDILNITIHDNGQGFDVASKTGQGNGLMNMKRRVDDVKGTLEISSELNAGTTISVNIRLE
jgi:signal transduction histidine kinase